jgi:hypothetical protein
MVNDWGGMMLLEMALAALVGTALGLRFQVYILVPATLVVVAVAIAVGVSTGAGTWWIVLDIFIAVASLQFGYLVSAIVISLASVRALGEHSEQRTTLKLHRFTSLWLS